MLPAPLHTATFDCWATLMYEVAPPPGPSGRIRLLAELTGTDVQRAGSAFARAWRQHQIEWHRNVIFAGPHMLQHTLTALEIDVSPARFDELLRELENEILGHEVHASPGARELLLALQRAGIRRALICDTGFSPGPMVRKLLDRLGLLELLEVTVFSEEVGVPKPHPRAFAAALEGLGVKAAGAVHVGDLRRSDIAGAQAAGMRAVRYRGRNDDNAEEPGPHAGVIDCSTAGCTPRCARPEGDAVVSSFAELGELLGVRI
ncbi:MAG TPA: HAD family hydrolase [Polyangiales bacterium]|nr:HAD family hydrolase [Polyangiales bacterium]